MESLNKKRVRVSNDSDEADLDSPEVKRLRDDLIGFLDDSNPDPESRDLDCGIRSLEDEISAASSSSSLLTDNTSSTEESKPELHYLLQASDDELGLPPRISFSEQEGKLVETLELVGTSPLCAGVEELWELENFFSNDQSFESGNWIDFDNGDFEYVALDNLFE